MPDEPDLSALETVRHGDRAIELTVTDGGRIPAPVVAGPALGPLPIVGRLGVGGMGEVLQVADRALNRVVAAKRLRGAFDERQRARFLVEAQVTGQLEHPNIVPIHGLAATDDGAPYFTMRQVKGEDLAALIRRAEADPASAPSPTRLLSMFGKICDAMAYAHARGVVHRDLKPANVMVGAFGEVVVMDWGLARVVDQPDAAADSVVVDPATRGDGLRTLDGAVVGTPAYMAPEQARGESDRIDARTDVYALGAILYALLTRVPPVAGGTVWEIIRAVGDGQLVPPSVRRPELRIPRELEAVVLKAMAAEPADRYPSAAALRADIEAYSDGRLLAAAEYGPAERLLKWVRRHRTLSACLGVGLLAAAAALVGWRWQRARQLRDALVEAHQAYHDGHFDEAAAAYAVARSLDPEHPQVQAGHALARQAGQQAAAREADRVRAHALLATARRQLGALPTVAALRAARAAGRDPAIHPALEVALDAAHQLDRAVGLAPADRTIAAARHAACVQLAELAVLDDDFRLARRTIHGLAVHGAPRAEVQMRLAEVAQEQARRLKGHAERVKAILADVAAGLDRDGRPADGKRLDDYVFEVLDLDREQTVTLLHQALDPVIAHAREHGEGAAWTPAQKELTTFAVRALGRMKSMRAARPLTELLAHAHDEHLIHEAGRALATTEHPDAHGHLMKLKQRLGDDHSAWKRVARHVGRIPPRGK